MKLSQARATHTMHSIFWATVTCSALSLRLNPSRRLSPYWFFPPFIAKFGKRNVALIGAVVAVIGTVSLFLNPSALNLALFACVMRGIGKGCFRGVKYSMLADVIEYGAWKSGIRVQGLMVSATTAGQKFGSGMTSAIFGALMSLVGFAGTATINAAQSQMLIGIYIIGNIIAWGGIGILLIFYKLDKIYPRIITEMKQREAAGSEA